MIRRELAAVAVGVVTLGVTMGCGQKEAPPAAEVVRPVKVVIASGSASGTFTFPGLVDAGEKALLSFRVSGRLERLPVEEGLAVEKGQLLAQLDPEDFQIAVNEARAEYTKAEADYVRYQRLFENDAVPLADLDLRRSQRDVAKARLDEAQRNLGYTELRAPFAGRIGRRYVENFMVVRANDQIVDLNDVENVEINFDIAENLVKRLRQGVETRVTAKFAAVPEKEFPLTLKEVANRADPATQTFRVKYLMPQPEEITLLPGMTAVVQVSVLAGVAELASNITLPAIAVVGDPQGDAFVWVIDMETMTVRRQPIRIGALAGTSLLRVREGLQGGETVVVAGLTSLQEGMKVSIWVPE